MPCLLWLCRWARLLICPKRYLHEAEIKMGVFVMQDRVSLRVYGDHSIPRALEGSLDGFIEKYGEFVVFPGFCDVHVHFREPGFFYKESIKTGTMAAARGGYTDVLTMPNLDPVPDSAEHLKAELEIIERDAVIGVHPYGALTVGERGMELAELSGINRYGITLVSLDEGFREEMEPGAAPLADRLATLKALSDAGCKTWVSMEPYPTPNVHEQELQPVLEAISFTDQIVFGRVHYDRRTSAYKDLDAFYRRTAEQVRTFCEVNGIDCHIKKGTSD